MPKFEYRDGPNFANKYRIPTTKKHRLFSFKLVFLIVVISILTHVVLFLGIKFASKDLNQEIIAMKTDFDKQIDTMEVVVNKKLSDMEHDLSLNSQDVDAKVQQVQHEIDKLDMKTSHDLDLIHRDLDDLRAEEQSSSPIGNENPFVNHFLAPNVSQYVTWTRLREVLENLKSDVDQTIRYG